MTTIFGKPNLKEKAKRSLWQKVKKPRNKGGPKIVMLSTELVKGNME